jgi:hypothetical protein
LSAAAIGWNFAPHSLAASAADRIGGGRRRGTRQARAVELFRLRGAGDRAALG